jgi:hypothetical protein
MEQQWEVEKRKLLAMQKMLNAFSPMISPKPCEILEDNKCNDNKNRLCNKKENHNE